MLYIFWYKNIHFKKGFYTMSSSTLKVNQTTLYDFILLLVKKNYLDDDSSRSIEIYYDYKDRFFESVNLLQFIHNLTELKVCEYVEGVQDVDMPLLDPSGKLNSLWEEWLVMQIGSHNTLIMDKKFDEFRALCYELQLIDKEAAHILYLYTRKFIIQNPIIKSTKIKTFLNGSGFPAKYFQYKESAEEYIKECYTLERGVRKLEVCCTCGYIFKEETIKHRLCENKREWVEYNTSMYIAKPEIFNAIINPGRFEIEVFESLKAEGFSVRLFPDIETNGDIEVLLEDNLLYLDMKCYAVGDGLYKEVIENNRVKHKYRNRWIIVADKYYKEQTRLLGGILNNSSANSRLLNIADLIQELHRWEDCHETK